MTTLPKHPSESRIFTFGFGRFPEIETNQETIDTVNSISFVNTRGNGSINIGTHQVQGSEVQVRISGGSDGDEYLLTCTITTSGDNILTCKGKLTVSLT